VQDDGEQREDDARLARAGWALDQRDRLLLQRRFQRGDLAHCARPSIGSRRWMGGERCRSDGTRGSRARASGKKTRPSRVVAVAAVVCSEKPHVFCVIKERVHNLLSKILSSTHTRRRRPRNANLERGDAESKRDARTTNDERRNQKTKRIQKKRTIVRRVHRVQKRRRELPHAVRRPRLHFPAHDRVRERQRRKRVQREPLARDRGHVREVRQIPPVRVTRTKKQSDTHTPE